MAALTEELDAYMIRNERITAEQAHVKTELDLASRIQTAMLPSVFPPYPDRKDFEIFASMTPAKEVGGDFYDFFLVDERRLCLVIADVSGKGIPAALFMMAAKITLSHLVKSGRSPAEVLAEANNSICSKNPEEMFVTVWLAILDLDTGRLSCAYAGHEYPMLKKPGGRYELLKDKHGFVLGGMENMKYHEYELRLEPGAALFLYTDGLAEALDPDDQMFGTERILERLNRPIPAVSSRALTMKTILSDHVRGAKGVKDMIRTSAETGKTEVSASSNLAINAFLIRAYTSSKSNYSKAFRKTQKRRAPIFDKQAAAVYIMQKYFLAGHFFICYNI